MYKVCINRLIGVLRIIDPIFIPHCTDEETEAQAMKWVAHDHTVVNKCQSCDP